jgi:hypothetical protein
MKLQRKNNRGESKDREIGDCRGDSEPGRHKTEYMSKKMVENKIFRFARREGDGGSVDVSQIVPNVVARQREESGSSSA